jgi:hypothetical protein
MGGRPLALALACSMTVGSEISDPLPPMIEQEPDAPDALSSLWLWLGTPDTP